MRYENLSLKHNYNDGELAGIAREYAGKLGALGQLETEAKSVASDFKAQMDGKKAELQSLSVRVNSGFEMRSVRCLLIKERPEGHQISIRLDTGRIIKRRKLESDERQMTLTTEIPPPPVAVAMLPVDDPDWATDLYQCPVNDQEFEELRHVCEMRAFVPAAAMIEDGTQSKEDEKASKKKAKGAAAGE